MLSFEWLLDRSLNSGQYSANLRQEIIDGIKAGRDDISRVLDAIHDVEFKEQPGRVRSKRPTQFRRLPLRDLWHKHYTVPGRDGLMQNIQAYWKQQPSIPTISFDPSTESMNEQRARQIAATVAKDYVDGFWTRSREGKLTGDWIVFASYNGINYYLTVGKHGEEQAVWERCKACAAEFPELKILQRF